VGAVTACVATHQWRAEPDELIADTDRGAPLDAASGAAESA